MSDETIQNTMARLGYTSAWMALGVIDEDSLRSQLQEYESSDYNDAEHYRWRAFKDWLQSKQSLSDDEINEIIKLRDCSPDKVNLGVERQIALIEADILTDEQFNSLFLHPEADEEIVQRLHARHSIYRRLSREGLSDDVFNLVKNTKDVMVHKKIVNRNDLTAAQVKWLGECGLTKAVRNRCKQLSQSRKYKLT